MPDHLLSVGLATYVAEVGGVFHVSISRAPEDGTRNDGSFGRVRAIRVHLGYETEGRGDTDSKRYPAQSLPIDQFGMGSADLAVPVPPDAPISYVGELMSVNYHLHITTDVEKFLDMRQEIPVVVAPRHGARTYHSPHPLRA